MSIDYSQFLIATKSDQESRLPRWKGQGFVRSDDEIIIGALIPEGVAYVTVYLSKAPWAVRSYSRLHVFPFIVKDDELVITDLTTNPPVLTCSVPSGNYELLVGQNVVTRDPRFEEETVDIVLRPVVSLPEESRLLMDDPSASPPSE
jgi:hypothetical protein